MKRLQDNPLKVSMIAVFLVFGGVLYSIRKRFLADEVRTHAKKRELSKDQETLDEVETPTADKTEKIQSSDTENYLQRFSNRIKLRFKQKAAAIPPEQQQEAVEKPSETLGKTYKQIVEPPRKPKSPGKSRPKHAKKMKNKGTD